MSQLAPLQKASKEEEAAAQSSLLRRVEAARARFEVKIAQHEAVATKREAAQVLSPSHTRVLNHQNLNSSHLCDTDFIAPQT